MAFQNKKRERDTANKIAIEEYNKGNYQQSIIYFTKSIELDPTDAYAYYNRGIAYYELKWYENAIADYENAIELDPNNAAAYNNRGITYNELKQYTKAIADYNKAIALDPKNTAAYNNRGWAYNQLKQYEKAIADCNKAIELDSNSAYAYNSRGWAYNQLKQYEKAIADCNKAIELDRNYANAYDSRGAVYYSLKQYDKAIANYKRAMELNPNHLFAKDGYEKALAALIAQKGAIDKSEPVVAQPPQSTPQPASAVVQQMPQPENKSAPVRASKAELLPQERRKLRQYLTAHFSLPELRTLAFDLNINYQSFPHTTNADFALEFITHCQRKELLSDLIELALEQFADPEISQLLQKQKSA